MSLAILWSIEALGTLGGAWSDGLRLAASISFAILLAWISLCVVALSSVYRGHGSTAQFRALLTSRHANIITVSGIVGAIVIALSWASYGSVGSSLGDQSWLIATAASYVLLIIVFDVLAPVMMNRAGRMPQLSRKAMAEMIAMAAAWVGIPGTILVCDVMPGSEPLGGAYDPSTWISVLLLTVMAGIALESRFAAIAVDAVVEGSRRAGFRTFDIPRGVYLIEDDLSESALSLFSDLVTLPLTPAAKIPSNEESATATLEFLIPRGLVVTREFPDALREKYKLQVTPIIWLTESTGERRIAPTSLTVLTDTLMRFMESNPNGIVLLEGVEYVCTFNDFRKVLKSLDSLNETTWITKSRLLITINPLAFDQKDLALLERDRIVLKGKSGIEELKRESTVPAAP